MDIFTKIKVHSGIIMYVYELEHDTNAIASLETSLFAQKNIHFYIPPYLEVRLSMHVVSFVAFLIFVSLL